MSTFYQRFSYWQHKYMADRLPYFWATVPGATISTDGSIETTGAMSIIYGAVKALFGCEPPSKCSMVVIPKETDWKCQQDSMEPQAAQLSGSNNAANLLIKPQGQFNIRMKG